MTQWKKALAELATAAEGPPMAEEWVGEQVDIIVNFIKTSGEYIRQLEQDYDEVETKNVRGSYGGSY